MNCNKLLLWLILTIALLAASCGKRQKEIKENAEKVKSELKAYIRKGEEFNQRNAEIKHIREEWLNNRLPNELFPEQQMAVIEDSIALVEYKELEEKQLQNEFAHNQALVLYQSLLNETISWADGLTSEDIDPKEIDLHWQEIKTELDLCLHREKEYYRASQEWESEIEKFINRMKVYVARPKAKTINPIEADGDNETSK